MTGGYAAVRLRTAQLKKAHRTLEQKVRERSAALEQARAEAIAATRSKSAFLATLSHEIRTPMTAIVGFAQLGSELCRPAGPRGNFIKIAQASQILLALLNDIVDFSKIEAGKLQLEAIPFSLTTLCQETLALFEQDAAARGLLLRAELAPDLPTVRGDPLRLQQILMNLLGNALKFTERGAIVLALRVVHEQPDTLTAELSVCDSGRGIAPEVLGGLFEDFAQGPADTSRRYGGTGLGLAIVRRLIDAMGGTLHVVSTLGAGSRFSLELTWPRCEPAPSCKSAALYRRWLAEFLREFAHGVAHIADLLSAQQWSEAEDRLHSLSGVAGNLGLIALQAEANRQERLLRHGQREALDVARLQAVFEASCTSAAKWLASSEFESEFEWECAPEAPAPAPAPASTSREHLLGQLKRAPIPAPSRACRLCKAICHRPCTTRCAPICAAMISRPPCSAWASRCAFKRRSERAPPHFGPKGRHPCSPHSIVYSARG